MRQRALFVLAGRWTFIGLLALGFFIRILGIPNPGTEDVGYFRGWGKTALDLGVANVYGEDDQNDRRALEALKRHLHLGRQANSSSIPTIPLNPRVDAEGKAYNRYCNYPPLTPYILKSALLIDGLIPSLAHVSYLKNLPIKAPGILFEILGAVAIFWFTKKKYDIKSARLLSLAYWLNPAFILTGAFLGYQDLIFINLALLSLLFTLDSNALGACAFAALALFTKQLALFPLSMIFIAICMVSDRQRVFRTLIPILIGIVILLLPLLLAGKTITMSMYLFSGSVHNVLSANAPNPWWLISFFQTAHHQIQSGSKIAASIGTPAVSVDVLPTVARHIRLACLIIYASFTVINAVILIARRRTVDLFIATGMQVYAYSIIMIGVHENHNLACLAFFCFPIIYGVRFWWLYFLSSIIIFANLVSFYGLPPALAFLRFELGVDLTVLLALANTLLFLWALIFMIRGAYGTPPSFDPLPVSRESLLEFLHSKYFTFLGKNRSKVAA